MARSKSGQSRRRSLIRKRQRRQQKRQKAHLAEVVKKSETTS